MAEIYRAPWSAWQPEIERLSSLHHADVSGDIPLSIDWDRYEQMDESDMLVLHVAVHERLAVGYIIHLLDRHPHHAVTVAVCDGVYVLPEYRNTGAGWRLVERAENTLKSQGVSYVCQQVPSGRDHGRMLETMGYKELETTYRKRLIN